MTYLMLSRKQVVETAVESQSSESQLYFSCLVCLTFFYFLTFYKTICNFVNQL